MAPTLYFVVPCFNEEDVLPVMLRQLCEKLDGLVRAQAIGAQSRVLFVDDGSTDGTWGIIQKAAADNPAVCGLRLAKNYGRQIALYAGLLEAKGRCDACITMDADGQDDLAAIDAMLDAFADGNDIVYGVRKNRSVDNVFKRVTARAYYWLLALRGTNVVRGHADYRLASARAIQELEAIPKAAIFLRGDFPRLSFQSTTVEYSRKRRQAGTSKYSLGRMLHLALDGLRGSGTREASKVASASSFAVAERTEIAGA